MYSEVIVDFNCMCQKNINKIMLELARLPS